MPSETELKLTVSLTDENRIVVTENSHEEFQKYAEESQKYAVENRSLIPVYCMQGDKVLCIRINKDPDQDQLEVKSVTIISNKGEKEGEKEAEKMKELFGLHEAKEKDIDIFTSPYFKIMELQQENQKLQEQLNTAKQDLETANQKAEQEKKALQTQLEPVKKEKQELQTKLAQVEEKDKQIKELNEQVQKLQQEEEKFETDNSNIANLQQQLKAKDEEIAQLKQQQPNAKVEELEKKLAAKNTEVQQLQQKNKELEAQKQPTEQPKPGKAPTYTAVVGVGLAAGLAVFIALEYTAKLEMLVTVGIALASALAVSGATYLALKPSTQVSETQEPQNTNVKGCCKP